MCEKKTQKKVRVCMYALTKKNQKYEVCEEVRVCVSYLCVCVDNLKNQSKWYARGEEKCVRVSYLCVCGYFFVFSFAPPPFPHTHILRAQFISRLSCVCVCLFGGNKRHN